MTGQPSTIFFTLSLITFSLYAFRRMYVLPSIAKQRIEAEMITRKNLIYNRNQIRNALRFYFRNLLRSLMVVLFCVFMSAVNFLLMILTVKTGGTPSPLWQVAAVVFLLSLPTFIAVLAKILDTRVLRSEIMTRVTD